MSSAGSSLFPSPSSSILSLILSSSSVSRSSPILSSTLPSSSASATRVAEAPPVGDLPSTIVMSSSTSAENAVESTSAPPSSTSKITSQSQSSRPSPSPSRSTRPPPIGAQPSGRPPPGQSNSVQENTRSGLPSGRSTVTSTITDTPESTFSSSVAITTTDSAGKVAITIPPAITSLSTSTGADGVAVTYTHVIANPTGISGISQGGGSSFMSNHAKVAGVFLAAGIVTAAIILSAIFCCWRRNRGARRRRRWISEIQRPLPSPPDPFEDPRPPPSPMRAVYPDQPPVTNWQVRRHTLVEDEDPIPLQVGPTGVGGLGPVYQQHTMGIAITSHSPDIRGTSQVSLAPSSPSIYPATLPAAPEDTFFEAAEYPPVPMSVAAPVPPRPPRSILRDSAARKSVDYHPMTPPPSESAHSDTSSKPPSPVLERQPSLTRRKTSYEDILNRRTLLDVRPKKDKV